MTVKVPLFEENQVYHSRAKHIDLRFHTINELISSSELLLGKVYTSDNTADILIKLVAMDKLINVSGAILELD